MHAVITGANGFVAQHLAKTLIERGLSSAHGADAEGLRPSQVTLMARRFEAAPEADFVRHVVGSISDPAVVADVFSTPVDVIFHLASIPAGTSEADYDLAREVNLSATELLLDAARRQTLAGGKKPIFVFSSSIAVLGGTFGASVDDLTPVNPSLTYGAQKVIGELWVEDYTRLGWVDGRSLRLCGIVARPPARTGQLSAFMSDIIRETANGRPFVCPVSEEARCWLMSLQCTVDNLILAAELPEAAFGATRTFTLPALHVAMPELVDAVSTVFGVDGKSLVTYKQIPALEANFGRYPPLYTPAAEALGFRHDGSLTALVTRALAND